MRQNATRLKNAARLKIICVHQKNAVLSKLKTCWSLPRSWYTPALPPQRPEMYRIISKPGSIHRIRLWYGFNSWHGKPSEPICFSKALNSPLLLLRHIASYQWDWWLMVCPVFFNGPSGFLGAKKVMVVKSWIIWVAPSKFDTRIHQCRSVVVFSFGSPFLGVVWGLQQQITLRCHGDVSTCQWHSDLC